MELRVPNRCPTAPPQSYRLGIALGLTQTRPAGMRLGDENTGMAEGRQQGASRRTD